MTIYGFSKIYNVVKYLYTIILLAIPFSQVLAFEPNDPYFFYSAIERPYSPGQWHLENNAPSEIAWYSPYQKKIFIMENAGIDSNLTDAWDMGYTGKGVVIGIADNGTEGAQEDIAPNYSKALSRKFLGGKIIEEQGPVLQKDNHGTAVAGVAAARGGNGIGGTGAAPYATIAGLRLLDAAGTDEDYFNAYIWKSGVEAKQTKTFIEYTFTGMPEIQIKNHSYGPKAPFVIDEPALLDALGFTSTNGVIHVFAAGNDRGTSNEDANKAMVNGYRDVINVAALGSDGKFSNYSSYGSSIFVTAPSNRTDHYQEGSTTTGFGITTTDRTGADLGYNRYSEKNKCGKDGTECGDPDDTFPDYNYTSTFGGTSSAAPLVSGIIALGKEANPDMDVRMAKHILARTSFKIDPNDASTTGGWLKNGAGYWYNPNYGFGLIDAGKFVDMATKVAYVTEQTSYSTGKQTVNEKIKSINDGGTRKSFALTTTQLKDSIRQPLEGVEILLNFTHPKRGDLLAGIQSPSGMTSCFLNATSYLAADKQDNASVTNFEWTFLSNAFWGENALGTWALAVADTVKDKVGTWNSYSVTFLMGDMVMKDDLPATQASNIKARSFTLSNPTAAYTIPLPLTLQVRDGVTVKDGNLVVNGNIAEDNTGIGSLVSLTGGIISGTGSIAATRGMANTGGTISPGNSVGILTINGNYNQGSAGNLNIEVASTTSNDVLAVKGSAALGGTLKTVWTGGYLPARGTGFGAFLTATSGISGNFSLLSTAISRTMMFQPKYDVPNKVYLTAERNYTNSGLLPYLTTNQHAIGGMLNSIANSSTGDLEAVLNIIDNLPSYNQIAYSMEQFSPINSVVPYNLGISGASFQTTNIADRLSEVRSGIASPMSFSGLKISQGDNYMTGKTLPVMVASNTSDLTGILPDVSERRLGLFVKGNAVLGEQRSAVDQVGYDFTTTGIMAGADYRFTKSFIAGIMTGIQGSRANLNDAGSKVKMNGYSIGTYGTYYNDKFYVDGLLGYTWNDYDNTRRIIFPGLDRTATSGPGSGQVTAYSGAGYNFRSAKWTMGPFMTMQYVNIVIDSYIEKGAGALNLALEKQRTDSLQSNVGFRASYALEKRDNKIIPSVWISYGHEYTNNSKTLSASLAQGGPSFGVETAVPQKNFGTAGTSISALFGDNIMAYAGYSFTAGEDKYTAHNINAGLKMCF